MTGVCVHALCGGVGCAVTPQQPLLQEDHASKAALNTRVGGGGGGAGDALPRTISHRRSSKEKNSRLCSGSSKTLICVRVC